MNRLKHRRAGNSLSKELDSIREPIYKAVTEQELIDKGYTINKDGMITTPNGKGWIMSVEAVNNFIKIEEKINDESSKRLWYGMDK